MQAIIRSQELPSYAATAGIATTPQQEQGNHNLQGNTKIKANPAEYEVYVGTAWKKGPSSSFPGMSKTGLGIFIQPGEHQQGGIYISTAAKQVNSPLRAEALALQVSAHVSTTLTSNHTTFLVDNQTLAPTAASRNFRHNPGHWEIRHQLATFFDTTSHIQTQVLHIPRNRNFRAHDCAASANNTNSEDSPKMTCYNSGHSVDQCPNLDDVTVVRAHICSSIRFSRLNLTYIALVVDLLSPAAAIYFVMPCLI